jgi:hypothetical protein
VASDDQVLEISGWPACETQRKVQDAFDNASDQGRTTWIEDGGKRICAIVPVDVAEADELAMSLITGRKMTP